MDEKTKERLRWPRSPGPRPDDPDLVTSSELAEVWGVTYAAVQKRLPILGVKPAARWRKGKHRELSLYSVTAIEAAMAKLK